MKHGRVSVRVCLFYKDCVGRMFKIMRFNNVVFEAAYGTAAQLPVSDLPEIVFSGRSNVGKSSLIIEPVMFGSWICRVMAMQKCPAVSKNDGLI